jgi:hypothetical protein
MHVHCRGEVEGESGGEDVPPNDFRGEVFIFQVKVIQPKAG